MSSPWRSSAVAWSRATPLDRSACMAPSTVRDKRAQWAATNSPCGVEPSTGTRSSRSSFVIRIVLSPRTPPLCTANAIYQGRFAGYPDRLTKSCASPGTAVQSPSPAGLTISTGITGRGTRTGLPGYCSTVMSALGACASSSATDRNRPFSEVRERPLLIAPLAGVRVRFADRAVRLHPTMSVGSNLGWDSLSLRQDDSSAVSAGMISNKSPTRP